MVCWVAGNSAIPCGLQRVLFLRGTLGLWLGSYQNQLQAGKVEVGGLHLKLLGGKVERKLAAAAAEEEAPAAAGEEVPAAAEQRSSWERGRQEPIGA